MPASFITLAERETDNGVRGIEALRNLSFGITHSRLKEGRAYNSKPGHTDGERQEGCSILPMNVGDIVIMHSPFTDEDTLVNYRGNMGGGKAVVIPCPSGLQMAVPIEWLRPNENNKCNNE